MRPLPALAALAAAVVALGGCGTATTSDIKVNDNSTFLPNVRAAVTFAGDPAPGPRVHGSHAVEASFSGGSGSGTQNLDAGALPVVFGGQRFTGPQELRYEFGVRYTQIAYRYRLLFGRSNLGMEVQAGAGYASLQLRVRGRTQVAAEHLSNAGFAASLGGLWYMRPSTSLQVRYGGFASGDSDGVSSLGRLEAYLVQGLGRHAAVRAGWNWWQLRSTRDDDSFAADKSPIILRISGPALGLEVLF